MGTRYERRNTKRQSRDIASGVVSKKGVYDALGNAAETLFESQLLTRKLNAEAKNKVNAKDKAQFDSLNKRYLSGLKKELYNIPSDKLKDKNYLRQFREDYTNKFRNERGQELNDNVKTLLRDYGYNNLLEDDIRKTKTKAEIANEVNSGSSVNIENIAKKAGVDISKEVMDKLKDDQLYNKFDSMINEAGAIDSEAKGDTIPCLLYTSPSPRDS